jgi:hypothetical protein
MSIALRWLKHKCVIAVKTTQHQCRKTRRSYMICTLNYTSSSRHSFPASMPSSPSLTKSPYCYRNLQTWYVYHRQHSRFACAQMRHELSLHASNARSEDLHSLKKNGIRYILEKPWQDTFKPPLDVNGGKGLRGWSHPQTARLLCPLQSLEEFDDNPE